MPNCESCGAGIDASDSDCPYCGASVRKHTIAKTSNIERPDKVYTTARDEEGMTYVRFGDGLAGQRPSSGSEGMSASYRQGAGSQGNVPSHVLEEKLDRVTQKLDRIPDPSKQKGSKDTGIVLVETFAEIGDMMSDYQDSISQEAHLNADDSDRLSKKAEKIRPKLKAMVAFCDKVDSKTKKRMGLSDSDIHKIRTTATRTLQITESSGKCQGCGTTNRPGSKHCQNCGAPL
jgi:hypothetical protein